jgi:hypothetical protein
LLLVAVLAFAVVGSACDRDPAVAYPDRNHTYAGGGQTHERAPQRGPNLTAIEKKLATFQPRIAQHVLAGAELHIAKQAEAAVAAVAAALVLIDEAHLVIDAAFLENPTTEQAQRLEMWADGLEDQYDYFVGLSEMMEAQGHLNRAIELSNAARYDEALAEVEAARRFTIQPSYAHLSADLQTELAIQLEHVVAEVERLDAGIRHARTVGPPYL